MVGFTKLQSSIIQSTIWRADKDTKILWITMLALSDKDGIVEGSIPGLADSARLSIEETEKALQKLMAPDPYSRSKESEGRRIEEIEGGWYIINYKKYRAPTSTERVRKHRMEKKQGKQKKHDETFHAFPSDSVSVSASGSVTKKEAVSSPTDSHSTSLRSVENHVSSNSLPSGQDYFSLGHTETYLPKKKGGKSYPKKFEEFWSELLELMRGRKNRLLGCGKWEGKRAWENAKRIPDWPGEEEVVRVLGEHLDSMEWQRDGGSSVPMLSTWLRAGRWNASICVGSSMGDSERLTPAEQAYERSMANIRAFAEDDDR